MTRRVAGLTAALLAVIVVACDEGAPTAPSRADVARSVSSSPPATGFRGTWEGTFQVDRCTGRGSAEDITCRRRYPPSRTALLRLTLSGPGPELRGRLTLGGLSGPVRGTIAPSGELTLTGSLRDETLTLTLTRWSTRLRDDAMVGAFGLRARARVHPGTATITASIRVLGRTG